MNIKSNPYTEQVSHLIVAIDGYSSTGKSTLAMDVAQWLNIKYIDSGAMYRAVALYVLRQNIYNSEIHSLNESQLKQELPFLYIDFQIHQKTGMQSILLNGKDEENAIRTMEVSRLVSRISQLKFVRDLLVQKQRAFAREGGVVMDGRDIGTVVFPEADVKFFLTASEEVRARRRYEELKQKGYTIEMNEIKDNIRERDHMDLTRQESPLQKAPDSQVIDNSQLSRAEQLEMAIKIIAENTGLNLSGDET